MQATSVSVSIRYSKTMQDGSHKTVELSVEGTLSNNEAWKEAQVSIYKELGENMRYVFGSNGKFHTEVAPARSTITREHWCSTHQTEYQRFSKDGKVWYSHKPPDGWCKEPGKK